MKKNLFHFLLMISIVFLFGVGCSDDGGGGPTGGDVDAGSLADRSTAPNEPVTVDNADQVVSEINTVAIGVYANAQSSVEKPAVNITANLGGEIPGQKNGKADVDGKAITKMSGIILTGVDYNVDCTYYDYSDDDELFLGGSIAYTGTVKYDTNNKLTENSVTMRGGIRFNGKYEGSEEFTITVTMDTAGAYSYEGTATITSDGETFTITISY